MCVILVARDLHPDWPVCIAANRDEFKARPSAGPRVLQETPRAIGGLDLKAGGTWMGATATGFFAGLTNQRTYTRADPARRSRGEVVAGALARADVAVVCAWLATLRPDDYNPFNLLFGTATDLWVAYAWPGEAAVRFEPVPPGLHVLPNDRLDSPDFPKVARAQALLAEVPPGELFPAMQRALADTQVPSPLPDEPLNRLPKALRGPLHALRVITPLYGTVSATAVALIPSGVAQYRFARGAPGDAPFEDVIGLLRGGG
ncbi:MAG: NRDE family protein [Myxococcales bacterium]|nr:NRDE family protein [Myxococcales bacterium]